jgi:tetratricopeptide (TPR) repeat protein
MNSPAVVRPLYLLARVLQGRSPQITVRLCRFIVNQLSGQSSVAADRLRAAAAVAEGVALASLGDTAGSIAINDYVIMAFKQSPDAEVHTHVAWAMTNKGWDLFSLDRFDEAIRNYEDLSITVPFEPPFIHPVAQGLTNWALALDRTGRHLEEMDIYNRIANALGSAKTDPEVHLLAWALLNKAITLIELHEYDEAIELCDAVLGRWWDLSDWNTSTKVREFLAAAIRHRANAMAGRGDYQVAIADVDRLLQRYQWSDESGLSEEVAWAMLTKAGSLEFLNLPKEAKHAYDALVTRFSPSPDKRVEEAVTRAKRRRDEIE